jgi:copper chaperone
MNIQLKIPDMSCSACGETIRQAVRAIDSTATVIADPKTKQVNITTQASETAIKNAIKIAGYQVS